MFLFLTYFTLYDRLWVHLPHIESRLGGTAGEGDDGINCESSTEIYMFPYVKKIAGGKVPHNTGSSIQCSVTT